MHIIFLLLSGTCSATASLLLRSAGQLSMVGPQQAFMLFDRPMLLRIAALGAYGAGFVFYALSLKKIELSVAYPLMVGVTIFLIFVASVLTNEAVTLRTLAGASFLLVGIVMLYSSATPRA